VSETTIIATLIFAAALWLWLRGQRDV